MKYFLNAFSAGELHSLFLRQPQPFTKRTDAHILRYAVGGLLYIPGADRRIADIIIDGKIKGLTSVAICLEDSVGDDEREACVTNVREQIGQILLALQENRLPEERLPLLFIRVKDNRMLSQLAPFFTAHSRVLTGVILPKVTAVTLEEGLRMTDEIGSAAPEPFYALPILESEELMRCDDRIGLLRSFRQITDRFSSRVLNIRIGATDLCGLYGIRRDVRTPIYSVAVVANCIADIVRVFGMEDAYTISAPVWEYFSAFARSRAIRRWDELDGLIEEAQLDLANGLLGKTCVHPTQLLPLQASYVVPYETYRDAETILFGDQGRSGVLASDTRNKMNELRPHMLWARRILRRAEIYGVLLENTDRDGMLRALYSREFH